MTVDFESEPAGKHLAESENAANENFGKIPIRTKLKEIHVYWYNVFVKSDKILDEKCLSLGMKMTSIADPIKSMLPTTANDANDTNQSVDLSCETVGRRTTATSQQPSPTILEIWNEAIARIAESNQEIEGTIAEFRAIREDFRTTKVGSGSQKMTLEEYERQLAIIPEMQRSKMTADDPQSNDPEIDKLQVIEEGLSSEKRKQIDDARACLQSTEKKLFDKDEVAGRLRRLEIGDRIHLTTAVAFILFFFYRMSDKTTTARKLNYRFPRRNDLNSYLSKQQDNFPHQASETNPYNDNRVRHFIETEITSLVGREQKTKAHDWPNYDGFVLLHFRKRNDDSSDKLQDLSLKLYDTEIRTSNHSALPSDWVSTLTCDTGLPEQLIFHAREMADLLASCSCKCFADAEKRKPTKALENQCFQRHWLLPGNLRKAMNGELGQTKNGNRCQDPFAYLVKCIVVNLTAKCFPRENLHSLFERTYKHGDIVKYEPLPSKSTFSLSEGDARSSSVPQTRVEFENVFVVLCNDCQNVLDDKLCSCKRGSIRFTSLDPLDHDDTLAIFDCKIRGCACRPGVEDFWLNGDTCSTSGCKKNNHGSFTIRAVHVPGYRNFFTSSQE